MMCFLTAIVRKGLFEKRIITKQLSNRLNSDLKKIINKINKNTFVSNSQML